MLRNGSPSSQFQYPPQSSWPTSGIGFLSTVECPNSTENVHPVKKTRTVLKPVRSNIGQNKQVSATRTKKEDSHSRLVALVGKLCMVECYIQALDGIQAPKSVLLIKRCLQVT